MLDFAIKVMNVAAEISDQDCEALKRHGLDEEDIWDTAEIRAFFGMSDRMANFTSMRPNDECYMMGQV